jgi:hypothetical protein
MAGISGEPEKVTEKQYNLNVDAKSVRIRSR